MINVEPFIRDIILTQVLLPSFTTKMIRFIFLSGLWSGFLERTVRFMLLLAESLTRSHPVYYKNLPTILQHGLETSYNGVKRNT